MEKQPFQLISSDDFNSTHDTLATGCVNARIINVPTEKGYISDKKLCPLQRLMPSLSRMMRRMTVLNMCYIPVNDVFI